jgi:hypothetical protein
MSDSSRKSELVLTLLFLAVITAVPLTQTALELGRGERVQFTDALRARPTARNLRQYEKTLEEKSAFQQILRPRVQRLLFDLFEDTGAKAVPGRDHWLFYRPDVRYLVEPNRLELDSSDSTWVQPPGGRRQRDGVVQAIKRFHDQLHDRGIRLLVIPVPGKPSVYPDHLTRRVTGAGRGFRSPTEDLLIDLGRQGVACVDLFSAFRQERARATTDPAPPLYLAQDTHWTPLGAQRAASETADRLRELGWAPPATRSFETRPASVKRWGDVIEATQIPDLRQDYGPEPVECVQVVDPALGLMAPTASDRPGVYKYPATNAPVLVLGDSFCRIYQYPEPQSLGELANPPSPGSGPETGAKRLLPGSAGFIAQLALALRSPVDSIVSDGGASTDVRRKLSTNPEILEGKQVVVWAFVERDVQLGRGGWQDVPLPPKLGP